MHRAVDRADSVEHHRLDALGHQVDIGSRQRRIPVVGEQQPFAPRLDRGRDFLAELGVVDLRGDELAASFVDLVENAFAFAEEPDSQQFLTGVDLPTQQPLHQRYSFEPTHLFVGEGAVFAWHNPCRGALEDGELRNDRCDLGHELHRAGTGADDGHALAGQVVIMVPAG